jgi:hypothetical protein
MLPTSTPLIVQLEVIKKLRGWADHTEPHLGRRGRAYLKLDHDPVEHHRHHPNGCLYCIRTSAIDHLERKWKDAHQLKGMMGQSPLK